MKQRTYNIGPSTLTLEFGDLTESSADVLVSSDDSYITMGGGVSEAIRRAGGDAILIEAAKMAPAALGSVVVTTAGFLKAKYIFHAITIGHEDLQPQKIISMTTRRCLELLDALHLRTIAFPAIGTGLARFTYQDAAAEMAEVITRTVAIMSRRIDITVYLHDRAQQTEPIDFLDFFENFAIHTKGLSNITQPTVQEHTPSSGIRSPPRDTKMEERRTVLENLAKLDRERELLEGKLANYHDILTEAETQEFEKRLNAIHHKRLQLLSIVKPINRRKPVSVFISYAHPDEELRIKLGKHLSTLERQGLISTWHDRMIAAGTEWNGLVDEQLEKARIVLLLISSDFVNSDYCYDVEVSRALKRHDSREAIVIPIILRPVLLDGLPFATLRSLPRNNKAVTEWQTIDSAFVDITEAIRSVIAELDTSNAI